VSPKVSDEIVHIVDISSGGKLLPIRISGGKCFQREYIEVLKAEKGHSVRYMEYLKPV
jgi:hypothetical protein